MRRARGCTLALCLTLVGPGLLGGCGVPEIRGSGLTGTVLYDLPSFDSVEVASFIDVIVAQGPHHRAMLTCDEDLLVHFSVRVRDGVLHIGVGRLASTPSVLLRPEGLCEVQVTAPASLRMAYRDHRRMLLSMRSSDTAASRVTR
ncbi:MAG: DUF2807 domain-containing protein [Pseudomonadota bacterium]